MKKALLPLAALLFICFQEAFATNFVFHTPGNWQDVSNWSPGYPGTTIGPCHTITIDNGITCDVNNVTGPIFTESLVTVGTGARSRLFTSIADYTQAAGTMTVNEEFFSQNSIDVTIEAGTEVIINGTFTTGGFITNDEILTNNGFINLNHQNALFTNNSLYRGAGTLTGFNTAVVTNTGTFTSISPALPAAWSIMDNHPNSGEVSLEYLQVAIETAQSGAWNQTTTWVGGVIPTSADAAVIKATHTVTTTGIIDFSTISIEATGTLSLSNGTNLAGTGGITNGGTVNINGSVTIENDITNNNVVNWNGGNLVSAAASTLTNNDTLNINAINAAVQLNFVNANGGHVIKGGASHNNQTIPTSFTNETGGILTVNSGKMGVVRIADVR